MKDRFITIIDDFGNCVFINPSNILWANSITEGDRTTLTIEYSTGQRDMTFYLSYKDCTSVTEMLERLANREN